MKTKVSSRTVFIAIVAALGGILFGYDTAVISGTTEVVKMQFGLTTGGEGWYVGCALIGSIIGVLIAGMMSDFLGRKKTMLISALLFSISAIGCAVCADFTQLVIYRMVGGFGIGIVSIVSPVYISEVSPAEVRGTMVSLYQLFITIGFLLAYLMNFIILKGAVLDSTDPELGSRMFNQEYWRGMLGCEAIPDLLFLVLIFFIPESPRWLQVRGQREDKSEEWKALREPGILKAVLIGSAIAILGQFMGVNAVLYYGPKIFADAGFEDPLFSTVLVGIVNMLTTVIALAIIDKVGRKQLVWWGVGGMIFCLLMIGLYFLPFTSLPTWFMLVFFLLYVFCTAISISAVVFVLLSEMYPNRVRGLAMSIAGFALWIGTYLIGQLTPWMLETLTPAGTFFLFAFMCVPYLWIMYKYVPNTTGKTLEEIEEYWSRFGGRGDK
ncbi:MAG: sugar porter family MFS transporter [Bacteroidales bacterium]|nr:sugar porter family MFS transporter [Bacteroidales bacterium]